MLFSNTPLYSIPDLDSRAASAENPTAEKSKGGLAGSGRKGAPCLNNIAPGDVVTLLDVQGSGMIRHIWMAFPLDKIFLRCLVLRMYWDGQEQPSVEVPVGDFFGIAHARFKPMVNALTAFQGGKALNCWIPMPFCKSARITIENDSDSTLRCLFYQIDFSLGDNHPADMGWFHAQFRRANCQPFHTDYVILDGIKGRGRYLGAVIGVRKGCANVPSQWWGEGEVKMYFDGEAQPTICGTGAEDYVGCAWGLSEVCTPEQGCVFENGYIGLFSMYRWHISDPICFKDSFRITIMQLGYGETDEAQALLGDDFRTNSADGSVERPYCMYDRSDDYCSVAYWYQTLPTMPFPPFPTREERLADLMLDKDIYEAKRNDVAE